MTLENGHELVLHNPPASLTLIRHARSSYNQSRLLLESDPLYLEFKSEYKRNPESEETVRLALLCNEKYASIEDEFNTPLADGADKEAEVSGFSLSRLFPVPDVVFVSPFLRTKSTLDFLIHGWSKLGNIPTYVDDRVQEQRHGDMLGYPNRRIFLALNPKERRLYDSEGEYYYRYPNGDSVLDIQIRIRLWLNMIYEKFPGKHVLVVTHHKVILAARVEIDNLSTDDYYKLDNEDKPINCGITRYVLNESTDPKKAHLKLAEYNLNIIENLNT